MKMMTFTPAQVEPIVDLWNRRVCGCYATGPMTPEVFLADVAGKAYFDPYGLILAVDGGRPVAFAHAGFKSTDWVKPDLRTGTVSMLAVEEGQLDAGAQALAAAVRYLLRRGAERALILGRNALRLLAEHGITIEDRASRPFPIPPCPIIDTHGHIGSDLNSIGLRWTLFPLLCSGLPERTLRLILCENAVRFFGFV